MEYSVLLLHINSIRLTVENITRLIAVESAM